MRDRGRLAAVLAIGGYNLIQNLLLPATAYVPANLVASLGLTNMARRFGCTWDDLGLSPARMRNGVRLGTAGATAASGLAIAAGAHRTARRYLLDQRAVDQRQKDIAYRVLVRFPFGTALFEEVAFRGVVYGIWRRSGASPRKAAAATAIAFGIWHLIPANQALTGNPLGPRFGSLKARAAVVGAGAMLTALSSFGFSWMRERSGSLVAPWMTHAAINNAGYLAGVAAWRRQSSS